MNRLSSETRTQVIGCLIAGCSIRATVRMTGVAKKTVMRLLVEVGEVCAEYQYAAFCNLCCKRLQLDEIWTWIYCKEKHRTQEIALAHPDAYGTPQDNEKRYSPAQCIGVQSRVVSGNPDWNAVSTGFVERHNWTLRTNIRRYLRNHAAAVALNCFAHNFITIHRTLRTSPAMAAGVTDRLWDVPALVALWEQREQEARASRTAA